MVCYALIFVVSVRSTDEAPRNPEFYSPSPDVPYPRCHPPNQDEAQRNPGVSYVQPIPHYAALHTGYVFGVLKVFVKGYETGFSIIATWRASASNSSVVNAGSLATWTVTC